MFLFILLCTWLCVCVGVVRSEVTVLTDENFDSVALSGKWFIKFYAPWCGHCKKVAPTWIELSNSLPESVARVAEVDCTTSAGVCKRFGVRGYPTLKLLDNGQAHDFSGARDLATFTDFATQGYLNAKPAEAKQPEPKRPEPAAPSGQVVTFDSADAFYATLSTSAAPVFVAFTAKWCGHCKKLLPEWEKLAEALKGSVVVASVDIDAEKALARQFQARAVPTLYLVRGRAMYAYTGPRSVEAFTAFVNGEYKSADPLVVPVQVGQVEAFLAGMFEQFGALVPQELQQWDFVRDFDKWFQTNTATALLIMSCVGVLVGFISGFLSGVMLGVTRRASARGAKGVPSRFKDVKPDGKDGAKEGMKEKDE